jgi:DNA-directed RNA polymerase specialized sigma24 family protein
MTGNRQAAEDIVQDAFGGLYRRWGRLRDPDKALSYCPHRIGRIGVVGPLEM